MAKLHKALKSIQGIASAMYGSRALGDKQIVFRTLAEIRFPLPTKQWLLQTWVEPHGEIDSFWTVNRMAATTRQTDKQKQRDRSLALTIAKRQMFT